MDCRVLPPRPSRKEPVGQLERRPLAKARAVTRRSLRSPGAASSPGSGSEKRRLLAEAERCKDAGTLGAFLRREHIYSSMISGWRKQIGLANQAALATKRRGPKPDASARQIQQLERDNARLRHKLERAELIIDAQKKLCVALGLPTADDRSGDA